MGALVRPDGIPLPVQIPKSPQDTIAKTILILGKTIAPQDELTIRFGVSRTTLGLGILT